MSVLDNIMIGRHHLLKAGFLRGGLYWLGGAQAEELKHRRRVEEIIELLEIEHIRHAVAGTLSYGAQRRLEIARALALKPRYLLLDEPAAGMNPAETDELMHVLDRIRTKYRLGLLVVEHDLKLIMRLCDVVVVLNKGQQIAIGTPAEIQANPEVIEAYIGRRRSSAQVRSEQGEVSGLPSSAPGLRNPV